MAEDIRNLRTVHLRVRESLNHREREWVVGHLLAKGAVENVGYGDDNPHRLVVEYDVDELDGAGLLEVLRSYGLHAGPAPLESPLAQIPPAAALERARA